MEKVNAKLNQVEKHSQISKEEAKKTVNVQPFKVRAKEILQGRFSQKFPPQSCVLTLAAHQLCAPRDILDKTLHIEAIKETWRSGLYL